MSLEMLIPYIGDAGKTTQSVQAWKEQEELRGRRVAKRRRYVAGDHDDNSTIEQRRLVNQAGGTSEDSHPFNENICSIILDTELDRINLTGVQSDSKTADEWITKLLERERIDGLQVDVHQAALVDGDTYIMVSPDPVTRKAVFTHEPAWDGGYGTVLRYADDMSRTPSLAIKMWRITTTAVSDTVRVNVYHPNKIVRWIGQETTGLKPYTDDGQPAVIPWVDLTGNPLGVPFIHYRNRSMTGDKFGLSELDNVIPLQDLANVGMMSMAATWLLSGFPIRLMIGGEVPSAVVPGMVLNFYLPKDSSGNPIVTGQTAIDWLNAIRKDQFDAADLGQQIDALTWLNKEMYAVTNTPTDDVAADASGEARKQSEVKLIGKVKRFEVKNGNAWEDAVRLAARIEEVYAQEKPPTFETLTAQWDDPEVRNDSKFVDDMLKQYREGVIDQRTYLESVQGIYGWDDAKVDEIIQRTEEAKNQQAQQEVDTTSAIEQARADAAMAVNGANGNGAKMGANG